MNKKTVMAVTLCAMLAVMAVVYAAFQTTLTVTTTTTQSGNFSLQLIAAKASVTGTPGLTGAANSPTASCTSTSGSTTGTMSATLYQPGDTVTCSWKVKNTGTLGAKANGNFSCSPKPSEIGSPFTSSVTWKKSTLAAGATSATTDEITMTIGYLSSITSQPTVTSTTITCNFPYTQNV